MGRSAPGGRVGDRPITRLLVVAIAVVVVMPVSLLADAHAQAGPLVSGDWQVSASYPASQYPDAISCPTSLDCFAAGTDETGQGPGGADAILATTDGGSTWESLSVPPMDARLNAISCTSPADCVAVGQKNRTSPLVLETDDGGSDWVAASPGPSWPGGTDQPTDLYGVACSSGFDCVVVGGDADGNGVIATISSAACCSIATTPSGVGTYSAVSCPSTTECLATGVNGVVTSANGGLTWTTESVPSDTGPLTGLDCTSTSACIAVGGLLDGDGSGVILTTGNGGEAWVDQSIPASVSELSGVSCPPSTSDCFAVGQSGSGSAANAVIVASTDGGVTWTSQTAPFGQDTLDGVDCPSTDDCLATDGLSGAIIATSDGGSIWSSDTIPTGINQVDAVSCPSPSTCYAVGNQSPTSGSILTTTDGGGTWSSESPPAGATDLYGISCPSSSDCTAVGYDEVTDAPVIIATADGGSTWTSETAPSGLGPLSAISCPSGSTCFAVGSAIDASVPTIIATNDDGSSWTSESIPVQGGNFNAISCASSSDCQAAGDLLQAGTGSELGLVGTTDGGAVWTAESGAGQGLDSVACPSSSDCYVVGGSLDNPVTISATTNGGATWTSQPVPGETVVGDEYPGGPGGISCPSVNVCYANAPGPATSSILETDTAGGAWTDESIPSDAGSLSSIACPSTSGCFVTGSGESSPDDGGLILSGSFPTITTSSLPGGVVGANYAQTLTATGGTAPYTWSVASGALPGGLSLDASTGVVSGVPDGAGTQVVTFDVTDANGFVGSTALDVSIDQADTTTTVTTSPSPATPGQSVTYSVTVSSSGGTPTGTVSFLTARSALCTATLTSGHGSCASTAAPLGADQVIGTYSGDTNFNASSGAAALQVGSQPGIYVPLTPARICNTRPGNPSGLTGAATQCNGPDDAGETLPAGGTLTFDVTGAFGVPANDVTAAVLNVTEADATSAGYFTLFPSGSSRPTASNLNFFTGQVVPNLVEVGVGTDGKVSLYSAAPADAIVDLEGYVTTSQRGGAGLYDALPTPARICNTRGGNPSHLIGGTLQCNADTSPGSHDDLVGPGDPLTIDATGLGGVPATGVSAVILNVTVADEQSAGYVTAYPQGAVRPTASNVNYGTDQVVANRVIVPVNPSTGQVTFYAAGPTNIIVDVSGYYTSTGGTGSEFVPEPAPVRICNTRGSNPSGLVSPYTQCNTDTAPGSPDQPVGPGASLNVQATGLAYGPAGASAAVLNVTAVAPTSGGYLTIYPEGTPPDTSDLNFIAGDVRANLVMATLTGSGSFNVYNAAGDTNVIVDVAGWYTSSDISAQSNLNSALTNAEAIFQQGSQSFPTSPALVATLAVQDPSLTYTEGESTAPDVISVVTSADGNAVIVATQGTGDDCWYRVYNAVAETASPPWSAPGAVFVGPGTWYGQVQSTGTPGVCQASTAPGGANDATQVFQTTGYPDL